MSYAVLGAMVFDGHQTPSGIADFLGLDRDAATRLQDKLEAQDLIRRDRGQSDRRSISIVATAQGEALAHEMRHHSEAVNAMFTNKLTTEQTNMFEKTIGTMLAQSEARLERL